MAETARLAIKTTQIVNRLQAHTDGEVELSATQVQAAKILLDKSLPSLQSADITAHSSAQIEPDDVLQAKLLALIRSNPQLIRQLAQALGPQALIEHSPDTVEPTTTTSSGA